MKQDGTTIFYKSVHGYEETEKAGSYLHVFEPSREKTGLIRVAPTRKEDGGAYPFALKTCYSYLGGRAQKCEQTQPVVL